MNETRILADGIAVFCAHDRIIDIADVKPNPRNPNRHPQAQIDLLARIIEAQGWRAPITISNRSGLVVRGHGRLLAALAIKKKMVPVDYQDYDSDSAEMADLMADNKIAELSDLHLATVSTILEDIRKAGDIDMELTGFRLGEMDRIMSWSENTEMPSGIMGGDDDSLELDDPDFKGGDRIVIKVSCYHKHGDVLIQMFEQLKENEMKELKYNV